MSVSCFPVECSPQSPIGRTVDHALRVLTEATLATAVLFDAEDRVIMGPIAGTAFVRELLKTDSGREAVIALHRAEARSARRRGQEDNPPAFWQETSLDHFAVPLTSAGAVVGTMTLGDRPRRSIPPEMIDRIARETGADAPALHQAAESLRPWTPDDAAAAKNLAALFAEMFARLCEQDQELRRRINELSAVYNISALLSGLPDLRQVLDRMAQIVCEVMHVKACSIRLLDDSSGALLIKAVHNLSAEYVNKGPVTLEQNPIDRAAINGEMVRIADAPTDPRTRYPEQARKEGIVSGLVCGMIYQGRPVGVLRVYTGEPHVFSAFEEALLRAVASQAAAGIMNARLLADRIETERYQRQLAYAGEVQRRMIPATAPSHPRADLAAVYRPTFEVGGDFYDFIALPKDNLGIAIADVSGKGVPASLQMASLRSALRVNAYFMYDINRILMQVNRHLCRDTTSGEFATVFYGVLTPDASRFTYCNAGHNPPMLLRNGEIKYLETGGMVLGIDPDAVFDRDPLALQSGDVILLYTDGVVDAMNFNDEPFGRQRLTDSFRQHAQQPAERLVKDILWDLRRFRGLADRVDDVTIVAIKIR